MIAGRKVDRIAAHASAPIFGGRRPPQMAPPEAELRLIRFSGQDLYAADFGFSYSAGLT